MTQTHGAEDVASVNPAAALTGPAAAPWFQVDSTRTSFAGDPAEASAQFHRFRAMHVASVLSPALLAQTLKLGESSSFAPMTTGPGYREQEEPQRVGRLLNFVLNRPELLRWLEQVTGCGALGKIEGRLARTLNRPGDQLLWHDDYPEQGRRLALVLNLSTQPFAGGEFEMRRKTGEPLFQHRYTELNSALIFAVRPSLEHRVLPLSSGGPRQVYAAWAFAEGAA